VQTQNSYNVAQKVCGREPARQADIQRPDRKIHTQRHTGRDRKREKERENPERGTGNLFAVEAAVTPVSGDTTPCRMTGVTLHV